MGSVTKNPIGTLGRGLAAGITGGISEFAQKNPFGAPVQNPINSMLPINNDYLKTGSLFGNNGVNPYISGPFNLDPNQFAADQNAITGLGNQQYEENLKAIHGNQDAQTKRAADIFQQLLPATAEDYNAGHLLNSSGYGNEVARQQGQIASQLAAQGADQELANVAARQGTQTAALQRGLGMEDFINQANVAKTIGAQMAPQPPSSKANVGTTLQGVGAVAPWANVGKSGAAAPKK